MSLETIQDICALDVGRLNPPKYDDWVKDIFDEFNVDDSDKVPLSILLNNLKICYLNDQEKKTDGDTRISLLRKTSMMELIFHYTQTWGMRKFIEIQPLQNPSGLVLVKGKNSPVSSIPVAALTVKSSTGVDNLFLEIQDSIIEKLYSNLDEPESIKIENLRKYLDSTEHDKVIYNSAVILDKDNFGPMISNAAIVRSFKEFNKEIIEVDGCIPDDEILLKKQDSSFDFGVCFCPYIIPMRSFSFDGKKRSAVMSRQGLYISQNVKDYFKRIKVVV